MDHTEEITAALEVATLSPEPQKSNNRRCKHKRKRKQAKFEKEVEVDLQPFRFPGLCFGKSSNILEN